MSSNTKTIAFVLYPGLTPLDLIGPLQVMSASRLSKPRSGCRAGIMS
jgi:hypothetical protein